MSVLTITGMANKVSGLTTFEPLKYPSKCQNIIGHALWLFRKKIEPECPLNPFDVLCNSPNLNMINVNCS